jgi:hypothetical protein
MRRIILAAALILAGCGQTGESYVVGYPIAVWLDHERFAQIYKTARDDAARNGGRILDERWTPEDRLDKHVGFIPEHDRFRVLDTCYGGFACEGYVDGRWRKFWVTDMMMKYAHKEK